MQNDVGRQPASAIDDIHKLTDNELETLKRKAIDAKSHAYCPYSNFRVGACLILLLPNPPPSFQPSSPSTPQTTTTPTTTVYITGSNIENASSPVGTCAETCALATAIASCPRPTMPQIRALAVATDTAPPASPCGMCRQFIREFCSLETPIYMFDRDERYVVRTLKELLPMSFGPEDLKGGG